MKGEIMATKGLYKRGNVWWIRFTGPDGKVKFESSRSHKKKDAEVLLAKRKNEVQEGRYIKLKNLRKHTFNELTDQYDNFVEKQRSYPSKKYIIKKLKTQFRNIPLVKFNSALLEQFQTDKLNTGCKPATVNRYIATLKHMFTKALDWEMVSEDTINKVKKVKQLEENNKRLRYLSPEECQTLINSCDDYLQPIVITALHTGMRKTEILKLKRNHVDMKNGFINLSDTKSGKRRSIHINKTLQEMLNSLVPRLDIPYVFFNPRTEKPYTDVKKAFNNACEKAKITDFRFHDLRHTFASQLLMGGGDLVALKEILGHADIKMTLRYSHLASAHMKKAVNMLDDKLKENSTIQNLYNS
jgi:integrase